MNDPAWLGEMLGRIAAILHAVAIITSMVL